MLGKVLFVLPQAALKNLSLCNTHVRACYTRLYYNRPCCFSIINLIHNTFYSQSLINTMHRQRILDWSTSQGSLSHSLFEWVCDKPAIGCCFSSPICSSNG